MHRIIQDFADNDSRVLDRLVDGELTELERRELLSALDDEPAGWRRCALAFLEAQSWGIDLKSFRDQPSEPLTPARPTARFWRHWPVGLAMAASLLLAFFGGLALRDRLASDTDSGQIAQGPIAAAPRIARATTGGGAPQEFWKTIPLPASDGSIVNVKAFEGGSGDLSWLFDPSSAIPADVLQQLEQRGHRIQREKELWPVQLQDGRRLIVPIEQVQVRYVGNESYQ
jgi:hypothetical protein